MGIAAAVSMTAAGISNRYSKDLRLRIGDEKQVFQTTSLNRLGEILECAVSLPAMKLVLLLSLSLWLVSGCTSTYSGRDPVPPCSIHVYDPANCPR